MKNSITTLTLIVFAATMIGQINRPRSKSKTDDPFWSDPSAKGIRALNTAEVTFASVHREIGFTCSLKELRDTQNGDSPLIDEKLASGRANGYRWELSGCTKGKVRDDGPEVTMTFTAVAVSERATTGQVSWCSNQSGIIERGTDSTSASCLARLRATEEHARESFKRNNEPKSEQR